MGAKALADTCVDFHARLLERRFHEKTEFVCVFGNDLECGITKHLNGVYYQMPELFNERPYYQKFSRPSAGFPCIILDRLFIFWSSDRSRWKFGALDDNKAGFAVCVDDRPNPTEVREPWELLRK